MKALAALVLAGLCWTAAEAQTPPGPPPRFAPKPEAIGRVVNVSNWSDYIDPKVLEAFTQQTGIKVVYDTYESNEALDARLRAGQTGYDVVMPSGPFLQRQIEAGLYRKLDKGKLSNLKNVWPEIAARLAVYDPGNQYGVDYMWFTMGLAANVAKAKARLGEASPASWDLLFRPELLKKLADCGVYVPDSPEDLFATALNWLKLDPQSRSPADLRRAADVLARMRPFVKTFGSSQYVNALASGDICLAVSWTGDAFQARDRAREAANGVDIAYGIPKEGAPISLDALAIPKDAPHPEEAYAFIDYLLRPEVAAQNTAVSHFANGVLAAKPLVDQAILANKAIYPDDETFRRLFAVAATDPATQKIMAREWTRVKTGR